MFFEMVSYSAVGKRQTNEDAVYAQATDSGALALVCDGLGGLAKGEQASGLAVEVIRSELLGRRFDEDSLDDAVVKANRAICALHPGENFPKTTIALLWAEGEEALAVNLGDSRIYQFRDGQIVFQSTDHSIPQMDVMAGLITPAEIRFHPRRNRLTKCLGVEGPVSMYKYHLHIQPGDRFLLCSDGFWEPVLEEDMLRTADTSGSVQEWLSAMREIAAAKEKDNHSAIAVLTR